MVSETPDGIKLVSLIDPLVIGDIVHWTDRQYLQKRGWAGPKLLGRLNMVTVVEDYSYNGLAVGVRVLTCRPEGNAIPYKADVYVEFKRSLIDSGSPMRELWQNESNRAYALKSYREHLRSLTARPAPSTNPTNQKGF